MKFSAVALLTFTIANKTVVNFMLDESQDYVLGIKTSNEGTY